MKLITIYTRNNLASKNYSSTFNHLKHTIEYIPTMGAYLIDNTLVPAANVLEVVVELPKPQVEETIKEEPKAKKTK